jgi:inosine-uridine nucleoside N-ribohydrolase
VILDTDIGDDIDDTWALGLLLRCPELNLKLVVTEFGKPDYRARLVAKFLTQVGRADIPVALGVPVNPNGSGPQEAWIQDFSLKQYRGHVHQDGVKALIDVVMRSRERVTIVAIGPATNLAAALEREPRIAERATIVGMQGSVRRGYLGKKTPDREYNVVADLPASKRVFTAAWPMCITPLDTCGVVSLHSERYRRLLGSRDRLAQTVLQNYEIWERAVSRKPELTLNANQSSTLYDTVAVYLAATQSTGRDLVKIETLGIRVDDAGYTREESGAKSMEVATEWKDLDGYYDYLVEHLTHGA